MATPSSTQPVMPGPDRDDFNDFLYWLVTDRGYTGAQVVAVVEKPWHYPFEYALYQQAGGLQR